MPSSYVLSGALNDLLAPNESDQIMVLHVQIPQCRRIHL